MSIRPPSSAACAFSLVTVGLGHPSPLRTGAWYFYPYGLQTLQPAVVSWWAAKSSSGRQDVWESRDSSPFQVSIWGSQVLALPVFAVDFRALTPYTQG